MSVFGQLEELHLAAVNFAKTQIRDLELARQARLEVQRLKRELDELRRTTVAGVVLEPAGPDGMATVAVGGFAKKLQQERDAARAERDQARHDLDDAKRVLREMYERATSAEALLTAEIKACAQAMRAWREKNRP